MLKNKMKKPMLRFPQAYNPNMPNKYSIKKRSKILGLNGILFLKMSKMNKNSMPIILEIRTILFPMSCMAYNTLASKGIEKIHITRIKLLASFSRIGSGCIFHRL